MNSDFDMKKLSYDFQGHMGMVIGKALPYKKLSTRMKRYTNFLSQDLQISFGSAVRTKEKFNLEIPISIFAECDACGKHIYYDLKNNTLIARSTCQYPGGYPEYSVEIDVPSGRLVFGNDFRRLVPKIKKEHTFGLNSVHGCDVYSQAYAKLGMTTIFVSNTSPKVLQSGSENIIIQPVYEEDDDGNEIALLDYTIMGTICTDLWWFCAMDYDHYIKRMKEMNQEFKWDEFTFDVTVRPVRWRFSGRHHIAEKEGGPFSVATWVGESHGQ